MSAKGMGDLHPALCGAALPACASFCIIKSVNLKEQDSRPSSAMVEKSSLETPSVATIISIAVPLLPSECLLQSGTILSFVVFPLDLPLHQGRLTPRGPPALACSSSMGVQGAQSLSAEYVSSFILVTEIYRTFGIRKRKTSSSFSPCKYGEKAFQEVRSEPERAFRVSSVSTSSPPVKPQQSSHLHFSRAHTCEICFKRALMFIDFLINILGFSVHLFIICLVTLTCILLHSLPDHRL